MIIRRAILIVPLLLVAWIAVMAGVMRFSDAAPAAVVLFPPNDFIARLPDGTGILAAGPIHLTLKNDQPGFARALYGAGALLVLPAGLTGCLPLPKAAAKSGV